MVRQKSFKEKLIELKTRLFESFQTGYDKGFKIGYEEGKKQAFEVYKPIVEKEVNDAVENKLVNILVERMKIKK